uniref:Uncharacterized protein n=1 Tax=Anguilla anguilla TaxID=7936 RepID=A0A0E9X6Y7_ANGAN
MTPIQTPTETRFSRGPRDRPQPCPTRRRHSRRCEVIQESEFYCNLQLFKKRFERSDPESLRLRHRVLYFSLPG